MAIFWNVFIKTIAIFVSAITLILFISLFLSYFNKSSNKFSYIDGEKNSNNLIAIIELNGLIIEKKSGFPDLTNRFIISPSEVKKNLKNLEKLSPKAIIFNINSPGGTVSASKILYDIIKKYKKNTQIEIIVHTDELLASGGYWVSTSADSIYANYGSIIGSIGVKGPDWFFYDKPISLSTGIFGNRVETKNGIQIFSNKAGKSKDIFNPFRQPTNYELKHLQNMVNEIYDDFVRIISKERKIETDILINDIGALIYNSNQALEKNLIDNVMTLEEVINNYVQINNFKNYKVIKNHNNQNSVIRNIINSIYNDIFENMRSECISLRTSIVALLNYKSTGC